MTGGEYLDQECPDRRTLMSAVIDGAERDKRSVKNVLITRGKLFF